jgi:transposase-like protein
MASYEIDLDVAAVLTTPSHCPGCGSGRLHPVARGGVVRFQCRDCGRLWAYELGTMVAAAGVQTERPESPPIPPQREAPS